MKGFAKINPEAYAVHALKSILFKGAGLWGNPGRHCILNPLYIYHDVCSDKNL
ncbi:MAG: hypothetical protein L0922_07310 [Candidatus Mariimomonas ferrooxydans]